MNRIKKQRDLALSQPVFMLLVGLFAFSDTAQAYIDPGSGHLIWQALLAMCFGLLFYARSFFQYLLRIFKLRMESKENQTPEQTQQRVADGKSTHR